MAQPTGNRSFLRHAVVYGLGNTLVYAASFVLLPLYTRCLKEPEFGELEILNRLTEVMGLCLLFTAMRQATMTFYRQSPDEQAQHGVAGTTVLTVGAAVVLGALTLLFAADYVADLQGLSPYLLRLAGGAGLAEGVTIVLLGLPQARLESGLFVFINVSQLMVRIGLALTLVWGLGLKIEGILLASLTTSLLFASGLAAWALVRCRPRIRWSAVGEYIRFCLPFLPGGLCLFVLSNGDRFLVKHWTGLEGVGAYALGYKLAVAVTAFTSGPLHMVWGIRMYDAAREPNYARTFGAMTTRILAVQAAVGLGVCLLQDEIVAVVGGGRYAAATGVVAPVVLAYWVLAGCCLMDAGLYICRRTGLKIWINLAAMVVVAALYLLLIPPLGIQGAAYATLGGFVFQALLTRLVVQRVFPVAYEDGRLITLAASAVLAWWVSRCLPSAVWVLPIKVCLWLLWAASLWVAGLVTDEEKHEAMHLVHWTMRRVRAILPAN